MLKGFDPTRPVVDFHEPPEPAPECRDCGHYWPLDVDDGVGICAAEYRSGGDLEAELAAACEASAWGRDPACGKFVRGDY